MSKKILLIDDELDILEILSYNLEKEGYDIYTATNGNEGIEKQRKLFRTLSY
jgi:two-component system alkaline phosphatase synthesis response regulator PhoP